MKACLFDMDGLLLDTETLYTIATSKLLSKFNKGPITWDVKILLQGLKVDKVCEILVEKYDLPLTSSEVYKINNKNQQEIWHMTKPMPGALELIKELKAKNIPIGVCTSSLKSSFDLKVKNLKEMFDLFDVIVVGDDERISERGKPEPDIWKLGLELLNKKFDTEILPSETLVFEDSLNGVISGKAFGGFVIWVPNSEALSYLGNTRELLEGKGEVLVSLVEFDRSKYGLE